MRNVITGLIAGGILLLPAMLPADDLKHQEKEAHEAQSKADKAQAKANHEQAKYDEKSYNEYVKDQAKTDKEWAKLDAKEKEDYYKWLKKHKH